MIEEVYGRLPKPCRARTMSRDRRLRSLPLRHDRATMQAVGPWVDVGIPEAVSLPGFH